jgi:purine-binding chemotaxis protein CheW
MAQQLENELDESSKSKYLIFRLGGERYGAPLLQVKEVIKMTPIKPVPHTVNHFLGVINLRGQIVSVVDLRAKLAIREYDPKSGLILVVDSGHSSIGALVDSIESVKEIRPEDIDADPAIETLVSSTNLRGVAKCDEGLTILIDLSQALSSEDMKKMTKAREAA